MENITRQKSKLLTFEGRTFGFRNSQRFHVESATVNLAHYANLLRTAARDDLSVSDAEFAQFERELTRHTKAALRRIEKQAQR